MLKTVTDLFNLDLACPFFSKEIYALEWATTILLQVITDTVAFFCIGDKNGAYGHLEKYYNIILLTRPVKRSVRALQNGADLQLLSTGRISRGVLARYHSTVYVMLKVK